MLLERGAWELEDRKEEVLMHAEARRCRKTTSLCGPKSKHVALDAVPLHGNRSSQAQRLQCIIEAAGNGVRRKCWDNICRCLMWSACDLHVMRHSRLGSCGRERFGSQAARLPRGESCWARRARRAAPMTAFFTAFHVLCRWSKSSQMLRRRDRFVLLTRSHNIWYYNMHMLRTYNTCFTCFINMYYILYVYYILMLC